MSLAVVCPEDGPDAVAAADSGWEEIRTSTCRGQTTRHRGTLLYNLRRRQRQSQRRLAGYL